MTPVLEGIMLTVMGLILAGCIAEAAQNQKAKVEVRKLLKEVDRGSR